MFYFKKKFLKCLLCFFALHFFLHADWNGDFDENTTQLIEQFPQLKETDYLQHYNFFKSARDSLLKDEDLVNQLRNWSDEKFMIQKPEFDVILKKRRNNKITDLYPWELSYLTGTNKYILPSFPVEIGGKKVIIQKLEHFKIGKVERNGYTKRTLKKISLKDYWKAFLQAYVLGLADLVGPNIGVNSEGIIRFFDNEACFSYCNIPYKKPPAFKAGFMCQAFDWPHFEEPLDSRTAKKIRVFIKNFNDLEDTLKKYQMHRNAVFSEEGVRFRLEKVKSFSFKKGKTFHNFFTHIHPRLDSGLKELHHIVNNIMKSKVSLGTCLFFATRKIRKFPNLKPEDLKAVEEWMQEYVD